MSEVFDLKARLDEMGVEPKKALGQNFLVSRHVIGKIIDCVCSRDFASLVEIGPGLGALTEPLIAADKKPMLIELDTDLAAYWRTRSLGVFEADALRFEWDKLPLREPALLVSNLPYQISTHIVVDRCFGPLAIKWMVLMFQKEVAQRLTAQPRTKEYGLLSVLAQLHFKITKVADAAPGDFFPPPKIASRVLLFERLPDPDLGVPFLRFLKSAFGFRRKLLLKNLKSQVGKARMEQLPEIATNLGIDLKARAEELTPQQLVLLFRATR